MDINYIEKISCLKICRIFILFSITLYCLGCNSQTQSCIANFNKKDFFVKYDNIDIGNHILYETIITNDSINKLLSSLMVESVRRKLERFDTILLKPKNEEYLISNIDTGLLNIVSKSIGKDTFSSRLIIIVTLLKSNDESIIDLFYFKRKKFCKILNRDDFFTVTRKTTPRQTDQKIDIKRYRNIYPLKKNILLIIKERNVQKIVLK